MVLRYGMSDALGSVAYDRDRSPFLQPNLPVPQERSYSEDTAILPHERIQAGKGQLLGNLARVAS